MAISSQLIVRDLAEANYQPTWHAMQQFTQKRNQETIDEVWLLEHPAIYTLGQSGKMEHVLNPGQIPVLKVDRGGQVTYHGPGQLIAYMLIDLQRRNLGVRALVSCLENTIIALLADYHITATTQATAPGVYVNAAKICSIGLRVRRGCSFHGLAFNIKMDLEPFQRINPCGYPELRMIQLSELIDTCSVSIIKPLLIEHLAKQMGYNQIFFENMDIQLFLQKEITRNHEQ